MAKQTYTTGQVLTAAQMTALQANDYNWTVSAKTASYVLVAADAGTRITMSNAGATTITVNTALFTAGDTLTITNIGAGACTITAGTATVSTAGSLILNQYDSGTLYFSSTSAAIWNGANPGDITGITTGATSGLAGGVTSGTASLTLATAAKGDLLVGTGSNTSQVLTVGSNNQTLVADSTAATGLKWATPTSGGMTLLSTTSLSGATTTISSISQSYKNLVVQIYGVTNATGNGVFRSSVNSAYPTYHFANRVQYGTISTYADVTDYFQWSDTISMLRTDSANAFTLTIYDYANTSSGTKVYNLTAGFMNSSSQVSEVVGGGQLLLSAGISAFSFSNTGGNLSTGTVLIYGVS